MADYNRNRGNDSSNNEHLWDQNKRQRNSDYDEDYNRRNYGGGDSNTGYGNSNNRSDFGNRNTGNYGNDSREDWNRQRSGNMYGSRGNYGGQQGNQGSYGNDYGRGDYRDRRNVNYGDVYHGNVERREHNTNEAQGGRYRNAYRSYDRNEGGGNNQNDQGWWDRSKEKTSSWFNSDDSDNDQRGKHRGKGPRGYKRSDDRIHEDVSDRLSDDVYVDASDVEVKVEGAEVILSGTVHSREEKRRAEDLAESVSGVTNVQNLLRVEQPSVEYPGSTLEPRRMIEEQRRRWW